MRPDMLPADVIEALSTLRQVCTCKPREFASICGEMLIRIFCIAHWCYDNVIKGLNLKIGCLNMLTRMYQIGRRQHVSG
jgi:hypothetical protein